MKQLLLLLLTPIFLTAQVDVPETQGVLVTKRSADWCPPCGGWAWDMFDTLVYNAPENLFAWTLHHSGGLNNAAANVLDDGVYEAPYQPRIFQNNTDLGASNGSWMTHVENLRTDAQNALNQTPVAQSGIEVTRTATDHYRVNARVKFFDANATGNFRYALYLVQRNHTGYQANRGNNAAHKHLIREILSDEAWGQSLVPGETTDLTLDFTSTYLPEDIIVVGVIWDGENDDYEFVNVHSAGVTEGTTATVALTPTGTRLRVLDNGNRPTFQLDVPERAQLQLDVFDALGRPVATPLRGTVGAGTQTVTPDLARGWYTFRLLVDGQPAFGGKLVVR